VLDSEAQIEFCNHHEQTAYTFIQDKPYEHTCAYDPNLIPKTGMDEDFEHVFKAIGWKISGSETRGVVSLPNLFALCSVFLLALRSDFSDRNTFLLEKD